MDSIQISFICKGNICRSCYAEYKLRSLLDDSLKSRVSVRSFGLETTPGKSADPAAIRIAAKRGLDLNPHRTTSFDPSELHKSADANLILAMELGQVSRLKSVTSKYATLPLSKFSPNLIERTLRPNIQDPWGLSDAVFNSVFDRIDASVELLLQELKKGSLNIQLVKNR